MNSEQIENALKENASTAPHFRDVYARDTLPRKPRLGFYVVNFDKMGESGSHWVCMRIGKSSNTLIVMGGNLLLSPKGILRNS